MPNLRLIRKTHFHKTMKFNWDFKETEFRNRWLRDVFREFYSEDELKDILSARRSEFNDDAVIADFKKCEQPRHYIPRDEHFQNAIDYVREAFRPNRKLHPVHYTDLRYYPWTLNVNAEAPWNLEGFRFKPTGRNVDEESSKTRIQEQIGKDLPKVDGSVSIIDYLREKQRLGLTSDEKPSFHNLYSEIFNYNRSRIHNIKYGHEEFWDKDGKPIPYQHLTLHARSHVVEKDEPDKIRAVFGAPKLLLMAELMFIWSLQATYLNTEAGRMLWGREISRGGWRRLFREVYEDKGRSTYLSVDWSGFDRRLLHELIDIVHAIWREYFDFTQYEATSKWKGIPKDPRAIERLWIWMTNAIKRTPILLPNQELWEWLYNGFGSGFQQTQLMDSFANAIMLTTCLSALGVNVKSKGFWARFQGDDSICGFFERMIQVYGTSFLTMLSDSALYYFNAVLSPKHSEISSHLSGMTVLSYSNRFGLAWRDELDLVKHLYFPERPQDFGRLAASAYGLAQAALGVHDRFHTMCLTIWNRLVVEDKIRPKWKALRWMVRVGMIETLEALENAEFPTIIDLQMRRWNIQWRTDAEKQRQWPTKPNGTMTFYFIDEV